MSAKVCTSTHVGNHITGVIMESAADSLNLSHSRKSAGTSLSMFRKRKPSADKQPAYKCLACSVGDFAGVWMPILMVSCAII